MPNKNTSQPFDDGCLSDNTACNEAAAGFGVNTSSVVKPAPFVDPNLEARVLADRNHSSRHLSNMPNFTGA